MNGQDFKAPAGVDRAQRLGFMIGGVALVLTIVGAFLFPQKFIWAYIFSYLFVLGLTLGSLGLLMLQHLTGGIWGIVIRRPLEAASRNVWLMLVMFVPIPLLMKYLYSGNGADYGWLNAPKTGEHALSHMQQWYLNTQGWFIRAGIYFAIWFFLVYVFNKWSLQQDTDSDNRVLRRRFRLFSGPGVILYVL